MKTTLIAVIMLLGGYNTLYASGENPSKQNKPAVVLMLENKAGFLKLSCDEPEATIQIVNSEDKVVLEQPFNNQPLEIDFREWEEGKYHYKIADKKGMIKQGVLQIKN